MVFLIETSNDRVVTIKQGNFFQYLFLFSYKQMKKF